MTTPTTHDLRAENLHQEYSGDGPDPEPGSIEQKSAKQELEELLTLLRAHINFQMSEMKRQADVLTFTRESLAAIRESLAGSNLL